MVRVQLVACPVAHIGHKGIGPVESGNPSERGDKDMSRSIKYTERFELVMTPAMRMAAQQAADRRGIDMSNWLRSLVSVELIKVYGEEWEEWIKNRTEVDAPDKS